MLLRMLAVTLVLVAALSSAPPLDACGFSSPAPCLARDLDSGLVTSIDVGERSVSWRVLGDPLGRSEAVRLADDELAMLRRLAANDGPRVAIARRPRVRAPLWVQLAPLAFALALLLASLVLRRRQGVTVRVLTRSVERREACALVYATVIVAGLVWATWPNVHSVTAKQFARGVHLGMVHDVTLTDDAIAFRHLASGATFVVPEPANAGLEQFVRSQIIHAPDPDRPGETRHHVRVHDERGTARWMGQAIPWLGALVFWGLWVYLIRRQSWW